LNSAPRIRDLSTAEQTIAAGYCREVAELEQTLEQQQRTWRQIGYARGGSFLLSLLPLLGAVSNAAELGNTWWWIFGAVFIGFLAIAGFHETLADKIRLWRLKLKIERAGLARFERRLKEIKEPVVEPPEDNRATCRDLDLFGEHSLYRLLGTARTPVGIELMRQWISSGADVKTIVERQAAVAALMVERDWRKQFVLECERLSASQKGPSDFVLWCQSPNWFSRRGWVLWISRAASVVIIASFALMLAGMIELPIGAPIAIVAMLVNFFLSVFYAGSVHDEFNQISSRHEETACYQKLFGLIDKCSAHSPLLDRLRTRLFETGEIMQGMKGLWRLVWLANVRRNGILFLLYIFFQLVFFWDIHVLDRLEKWKGRFAQHARFWFGDLGEWEAITALAKFAADHPDWKFPKVVSKNSGPIVIEAKKLGHPLLPLDCRVDNDVQVGPAGTFLLVTGSNMSGKSTLLRSLGLNVTLAQLGTVVCAESMTLPSVVIDTSMRISDSLSDGVSFFMAELQRLKQVVDRSEKLRNDSERGHLFLLDEILQGTNSRERQIAVAQVVKTLVEQRSIGAISTHDLELAGVDSLKDICQIVHFTESFETRDGVEVMTFDYLMHPGVAPTTNALKLLEFVGLSKKRIDA
jgi:MutS domain V